MTALKNAWGQNWIKNRAEKFKIMKSGYTKIRPKIFPKGLTTFKKEHCEGFDDNRDNFLQPRSRIHSVDVIDDNLRSKFDEQHALTNSFSEITLNGK